MIVNQEQLAKINSVQVEILKEVIRVCDVLDINYYMVHGSLLGTVMSGKFMPFDDDIDIAMHRDDYEKFLEEGSKIIKDRYFVQANKTDKDYPLPFAKVRDCTTTYITEVMKDFNINHGIYIDIFPIDYCSKNDLKAKVTNVKLKMLGLRIAARYKIDNTSLLNKIIMMCSVVICPSWHRAIRAQERLYSSQSSGDTIRLTGGKRKEKCIPTELFKETEIFIFEGMNVKIPKMYHEYLTIIYGDYKNCFLAEGKMYNKNEVIINACVVDTINPYTKYIQF